MNGFIYGVLLAFGLIMPLGVQNMFVFNQGVLQPAFKKALPVIITAALCDTLLILTAVQGVSLIIMEFIWLKNVLIMIGSIFLLYMGWLTWQAQPDLNVEAAAESFPAKRQVLFAMGVSLLNPHAILDTIGVIGANSLRYNGEEKLLFTTACIGVSWLWFLGLAMLGRMLGRTHYTMAKAKFLNKVSAVIIWGSAVYMVSGI